MKRFHVLVVRARLRRRTVAVGAAALCMAAGAGGVAVTQAGAASSTPVAHSAAYGAVTIATPGAWSSFDFLTETLLPAYPIMSAGYDSLTAYAPNSAKLVPYLAASWKTTASSVTFTLKSGTTCPGGTPITPSVIAASFDAYIKTSTQIAGSWGPGSFTVTTGSNTVTVTDSTPDNTLIYGVGPTFIVCPAGINNQSLLQNGVEGSGPYKLTANQPGVSATMTLNPAWTWGPNGTTTKAIGMPRTLKFIPVADETTAANELLTGALDIAEVSGPDVTRLLASKSLNSYKTHQFIPYTLEFDLRSNHVTAAPILRKALSMVVNTADYNKAEFNGNGLLTTSIVTPDTPCFDKKTSTLDPTGTIAQAKALLTKNGYKYSGGKLETPSGTPVALSFLKLNTMAQGIDYIASVWQSMGISVTINAVPYTQWVTDALSGNWDTWVNTMYSGFPSVSTAVTYISGPGYPQGFNSNGMTDNPAIASQAAALAASVKAAEATPTVASSCSEWDTYQELLLKNALYKPLAAPYVYTFVKKGVTAQAWGNGADSTGVGVDVRSLRIGKNFR